MEILTSGHPEDAGVRAGARYCIITVSNDAAEMHPKLNYITHEASFIHAAAAEMALNFRHLAISVFISFYNYSRISSLCTHNDLAHRNKHTRAKSTSPARENNTSVLHNKALGTHEFVRIS